MAGGPALGGGLAIDDRLAPRRAVHDPVVPDHVPLAWQVKGEHAFALIAARRTSLEATMSTRSPVQ